MCFSLASAPLIFTKVIGSFATYLCRLSILIHLYLDNWLIRAKTILKIVLELADKLGIMINWKKSDINPGQLFVHLCLRFHLKACLVFPTTEALSKIQIWSLYLRKYRMTTARAFISFLGILNT